MMTREVRQTPSNSRFAVVGLSTPFIFSFVPPCVSPVLIFNSVLRIIWITLRLTGFVVYMWPCPLDSPFIGNCLEVFHERHHTWGLSHLKKKMAMANLGSKGWWCGGGIYFLGVKRPKRPGFLFLGPYDTYRKIHAAKKMGQNVHSSPQRWTQQSTDAYKSGYMGFKPATR